MEKLCKQCGIVKSDLDFFKCKSKSDGLQTCCKICSKKYWRKMQEETPELLSAKRKKWNLANRWCRALWTSRSTAKIRGYVPCTATPEQLRDSYTGNCFVCGVPEEECKTLLSADHNHETGEFRCWLCKDCNHGIGLLKDNPDVLERAALYVRQHEAVNESETTKVSMENENTF